MQRRDWTHSIVLMAMATCVMANAHAHDAPATSDMPASPIDVPLDVARWTSLARMTVTAQVHGAGLTCDGIALAEVLQQAGAMPKPPLKGADLARIVVLTARDGYRVAFALGELDPTLGQREAWLTDRCNGKTLGADTGPWRLLVPGDGRAARGIRQVESIRVVMP